MAIDSATSLLFAIGANTDDAEANISRFRGLFSSSLSDLTSQFHSFAAELTGGGEEINASFTAMASIAAGAALAIGAGIFEMARKTAEAGEQLLLLSQQVGLSVEELSGLKVVAEQMGVDFDTLSRGVAIMDRSLSPFASSGATAAKALASIGVTATTASGQLRPNVQILADVADKFATMQDGANKTALAMSIFGRSGMEMIPILDKGGIAIRSAADEATRLGLVWTKDGAEHSAQFEEATRNLTMTFEGLVQKIGMKVIPMFTDGLAGALHVVSDAFGECADHATAIERVLEAATAMTVTYAIKTGSAALAAFGLDGAIGALTAVVAIFERALWTVSGGMIAATAGFAAVAAAVYVLIDRLRQLHETEAEAAQTDALLAGQAQVLAAEHARVVVEVEKVTGARLAGASAAAKYLAAETAIEGMTRKQFAAISALESTDHSAIVREVEQVTGAQIAGATAADRYVAAQDAIAKMTKAQLDAYAGLEKSRQVGAASVGVEIHALSDLSAAYRAVIASIQSLQDAQSKPEAAAQAEYQRGLARAQKQLEDHRKDIAAGKQTDETLAQYDADYQKLKGALAQQYLLKIQQIWAQEDAAAAAREQSRAKALQTSSAAASEAATKMWQAEGAAVVTALDRSDKAILKQIESAHELQASVDTTAEKLTAMGTKSSDATLSAGDKIRAEYQRQINAINQLVATEQKKGITEQQQAQLTRAAAAAQHSATEQEATDLAKLRQQQLLTATQSINSFAQMGLAAAGYRSAMVDALMKVISVLEQELIAHMTSAAGAAAAESAKNAAVGQGVGLRAVWHAAEQFALGLADAASLNFAGAAAHFAASGSFAAVAASVGTAVAGLFSAGGAGGGSSRGAAGAAASSAGSQVADAGSSSGGSQTVVSFHFEGGLISADVATQVMQQFTNLVATGQGILGASHAMSGGALVATR